MTDIWQSIIDEIKSHDRIVVSRHSRPDGDAVGSSMGLYHALKAGNPTKQIWLDNEDYSDYVAFLGDEGPHPADEDYQGALVIVVDTGTANRISNKRYDRGDKVIKIDHHIIDNPYGDIVWVEEESPSCAEMVARLCLSFPDVLPLTVEAATCLYTGITTDTGRFRFRGVGASTLQTAAKLLERGIDTERIYANLYLDDYDVLLFRANQTRRIKQTEHGVAYLTISNALQRKYGLSREDASNTVSLMEKIKGCIVWLAFIENEDKSIRVRLRSRFVEVQPLATRYHGGGHACAAGATVYSKEEMQQLIDEADALVADYKAHHDDWL